MGQNVKQENFLLAFRVLGLLFWVTSLQLQLDSISGPRTNVYSKDLQPAEANATLRGSADVFRVPKGMEHLHLMDTYQSYRNLDSTPELQWTHGTFLQRRRHVPP